LVFGTGSILLLASKQRKYLDKASIWCIGVYLTSIIILCAYSIYDAIALDNETLPGMKIPTMTAEFLSIGVFLYFMYDLHLVKLRLECVSQETFKKKHSTLARFFKYLIFPSVILTWLMKASLNILEPNEEKINDDDILFPINVI
jgi:hypothetical protein